MQSTAKQDVLLSTGKKNATLIRNAIIAVLLVALLGALFIPFSDYSYTKKVTVKDPETGKRQRVEQEYSGKLSLMDYIWRPYTDASKEVAKWIEKESPIAREGYNIANVVLMPLGLMLLTVLALAFALRFHKTFFAPGFSCFTALFGAACYAVSPLMSLQPGRFLLMGLYIGIAAGCAVIIISQKQALDAEKRSPHYKLAHYNEQPLLLHIKKNWMIYSFLIVPVIYFVVFRYAPMLGNLIAFRTYRGGPQFLGTGWRGLEYFSQFLAQEDFWRAFRNTLTLSLEYLALRFPLTLAFALLLNELRNVRAKKFVQTVSYLPHFISTVILVGMVKEITSTNGPINMIIKSFGNSPILFVQKPEWFHTLYIVSGLWQGLGWGTILYLAAMTNINTELYEAAEIDGANRFHRVWHVTIPGILPTVCTLLVLDIGGIMGSNFEKILLMYDPLTYETADVISTYVYRMGVAGGQFSFSTAIGLFEGIIGLVLVSIANAASRKLTDSSLW